MEAQPIIFESSEDDKIFQFYIPVSFFHVFIVNNIPGGGVLARFYRRGGLNSFLPGGGELAHQKNCTGVLPGGGGGGGGRGGMVRLGID